MKALVTGAAGFIGSHVVDGLRANGVDVLGLDSLDPGVHQTIPNYLRADVEYCFADLRYWEPDGRFEDVEIVVHLAALGGVSRAARERANIVDANVRGTARLLELASKWPHLGKIIHASSFSVYGSNYAYRCPQCGTLMDGTRKTEDLDRGQYEVLCPKDGAEANILPITTAAAPTPLEVYGASKYMQELCYKGFKHSAVQILRFSSVYGQRMRVDDTEATIIARLAGWIRAGQRPKLYEDGRQIRDWVYVGDIVDTVVALLSEDVTVPVINVCSGIPVRLDEACQYISSALGKDCPPEIVGGYRPGDMRHCLGDPTDWRQLLGREPAALGKAAALAFGTLSG